MRPDIEKILVDQDIWGKQAKDSLERKAKLQSFGQNAFGVLVKTPQGLYVVDPEDGGVSHDLLKYGIYNKKEVDLARSFTTKDSDILVVGAHLGTHAISLAQTCRHVTAIEANPHTFILFEANVLLNKVTNIELHNLAAAEAERQIEFILSRANSGGSKRGPLIEDKPAYVYDAPERVQVQGVALDQLLAGRSFDMVLMDIEGSEYYALQGMQQILTRTNILVMEYLPHLLKYACGVKPKQIADLILPHFDWLFVPGDNTVVPKYAIENVLTGMYDANCGFDNLYFFRDPLPARLRPPGI